MEPDVVWDWFLILVKPEAIYVWKMKISKKGRQRGCRSVSLKWSGDYMKKYEFHLRNWLQSFVACYIWSKPIFGNTAPPFAPPFYAPLGAPPFHIRDPKVEIVNVFFRAFALSMVNTWLSLFSPYFRKFLQGIHFSNLGFLQKYVQKMLSWIYETFI